MAWPSWQACDRGLPVDRVAGPQRLHVGRELLDPRAEVGHRAEQQRDVQTVECGELGLVGQALAEVVSEHRIAARGMIARCTRSRTDERHSGVERRPRPPHRHEGCGRVLRQCRIGDQRRQTRAHQRLVGRRGLRPLRDRHQGCGLVLVDADHHRYLRGRALADRVAQACVQREAVDHFGVAFAAAGKRHRAFARGHQFGGGFRTQAFARIGLRAAKALLDPIALSDRRLARSVADGQPRYGHRANAALDDRAREQTCGKR